MLAQLGNPEPNDIILELSDETYYLDATREWRRSSQQAMQVVDDQVVLDTVLDQPLGALRDVSYQLYCGDEILESAFEQRPDKLCVPRAARGADAAAAARGLRRNLHQKNVAGAGITPREIREFCLWRQAPMFYVDCQGRLLDKYEPSVKEQRAVAFTSWNGHAFFCKSARTVAKCEPIGERARYRGERKPGETPEFKQRPFPHRRPGAGPEGAPGRGTLPEGGHAKHERVAVPAAEGAGPRGLRHLRLPRRPGRAAGLDAAAGAPLLRAASGGRGSEVFLHLLKARRDPLGSRQALLSEQDHQCKLCAAPITATKRPWSPARHDTGVALQPAGLRAVVESPRIPPLVFKLNSHKPDHICYGLSTGRVPQERPGPCQVPDAHLLPQRQRGASRRRAPGGSDLREAPRGRTLVGRRSSSSSTWTRAGTPSLPWPSCWKRLLRPGATSCTAWTPRRTAHVDQESVNLIYTMRTSNPSSTAPGASTGSCSWTLGWNALGSHLRDKVVVQSELPANFVMASKYVTVQNKGCTGNRRGPEGRQTASSSRTCPKSSGLVDGLVPGRLVPNRPNRGRVHAQH